MPSKQVEDVYDAGGFDGGPLGRRGRRLKTVDEHNAEVRAAREAARHSGILCPACRQRELLWGDTALSSYPPLRRVFCTCGFQGGVE